MQFVEAFNKETYGQQSGRFIYKLSIYLFKRSSSFVLIQQPSWTGYENSIVKKNHFLIISHSKNKLTMCILGSGSDFGFHERKGAHNVFELEQYSVCCFSV